MNVQSIGSSNQVSTTPIRNVTESPAEPEPAPEQTTVAQAAETTNAETKQKGVLRLLQEGHFKGVSDIRLRINFHDEIAAMDAEAAKAAAASHEQSILDAVTTQLGAFSEDQTAATTDISSAFAETAAAAFAGFADGNISQTDLSTALQTSFDQMITGLRGALETETLPEPEALAVEPDVTMLSPDPAAAPTTAVSDTDAPESDPAAPLPATTAEDNFALDTFLADLTAAFDSALAELTLSLESASALPELSQPHGNGGAYAKFLATYNDLYGTSTTDTLA